MSMPERKRVEIGDIKMSYEMQPVGLDGRWINGGNHYANADTAEGARDYARRVLTSENGQYYSPYTSTLIGVDVYGQEMEFYGPAWQAVRGGRTESFRVTREELGLPPVFLTRETMCWDTTVMDYPERVHAMMSNGSCQCGNPTAGYGGAPQA